MHSNHSIDSPELWIVLYLQKDVSLALMNQLGETGKDGSGPSDGRGGGGTISLADYCSMKAVEAPGSRLQ